jgi:hypothetical protein
VVVAADLLWAVGEEKMVVAIVKFMLIVNLFEKHHQIKQPINFIFSNLLSRHAGFSSVRNDIRTQPHLETFNFKNESSTPVFFSSSLVPIASHRISVSCFNCHISLPSAPRGVASDAELGRKRPFDMSINASHTLTHMHTHTHTHRLVILHSLFMLK